MCCTIPKAFVRRGLHWVENHERLKSILGRLNTNSVRPAHELQLFKQYARTGRLGLKRFSPNYGKHLHRLLVSIKFEENKKKQKRQRHKLNGVRKSTCAVRRSVRTAYLTDQSETLLFLSLCSESGATC